MPIPKYDEIMLPLLKVLSDGQTHTKRELTEKMADHFHLTPEERAEVEPPPLRDLRLLVLLRAREEDPLPLQRRAKDLRVVRVADAASFEFPLDLLLRTPVAPPA